MLIWRVVCCVSQARYALRVLHVAQCVCCARLNSVRTLCVAMCMSCVCMCYLGSAFRVPFVNHQDCWGNRGATVVSQDATGVLQGCDRGFKGGVPGVLRGVTGCCMRVCACRRDCLVRRARCSNRLISGMVNSCERESTKEIESERARESERERERERAREREKMRERAVRG